MRVGRIEYAVDPKIPKILLTSPQSSSSFVQRNLFASGTEKIDSLIELNARFSIPPNCLTCVYLVSKVYRCNVGTYVPNSAMA